MAKEFELGEAVTGIAWLELMSTDEENLNDTVIFKQSYEGKIQHLHRNIRTIHGLGPVHGSSASPQLVADV